MGQFLFRGEDSSSAYDFFTVTTNDSADQPSEFRALYIGVGGNVSVVNADGTNVTFNNCYDGQVLPIRGRRVRATDTTATNIVGLI